MKEAQENQVSAGKLNRQDVTQRSDSQGVSAETRLDRHSTSARNKTEQPSTELKQLFDLVFFDRMDGRSVLAVGRDARDFATEARQRGAHNVADSPAHRSSGTQRGKVNFVENEATESGDASLAGQSGAKKYDDVLCINAIEQSRAPFVLLDSLIDSTKCRLIVDVARLDESEQKALRLNWWRRMLLRFMRHLPIVFVSPVPLRKSRRRFFLSPSAVNCFLTRHRAVFSRIDVRQSPIQGRQILIAHKRRIDNLVVLAGPTSAGKSTLKDRLETGDAADVCSRLGIEDISDWEQKEFYSISNDERPHLTNLILHYDFLTRLRWNLEDEQMVELLDVLSCAAKVTFLTIWTEPLRLRKQFEESEIKKYIRERGCEPKSKKTLRLREDYKDPKRVFDFYRSWFDFVSTTNADQLVFTQSPQARVMSLRQWRLEHPSNPNE